MPCSRTWIPAVWIALAGVMAACTTAPAQRPAAELSGPPPAVPRPEPASAVWPEAVRTLPGRLARGIRVKPVALLSETEALMVTSAEARPTFYSYDLRTGRHRALATAPEWGDCNLCYVVRSVAVGETRIAWTAEVYRSEPWNAGHRHMELWSMPRSGGPMRLVAWLTGHGEVAYHEELTIEGEHARWIGPLRDGYRVPLNGGLAQAISRTPPPSVPIPGTREVWCAGDWCVGRVPPRNNALTTLIVQRGDGSRRAEIAASDAEGPLLAGRFGWFGLPYVYGDASQDEPNGARLLHDMCTGRSGRLGAEPKKTEPKKTQPRTDEAPEVHRGAAGSAPEILFWATSGKERTWTVLDLSRVAPCSS
ncbi:hypothetical protein HII36_33860 [Nonomuraea sp. NN258]|uniref:hypothetical protein n=1 Tax=Nonomuraea antri TaxID=2730852 RepID=UPI001569DD1C|nr:hypothetical protein [Nonomuraea antri]NRQ36787.1 hypothetical protein [Nonomuraea antri]